MHMRAGFLLGIAIAITTSGTAHAEDLTTRAVTRAAVTEAICRRAETRIGLRIDTLTGVRTRRVAAYQKGVDQYKALVDSLDAKGYDTTKLKADLKTWNEKILAFGAAFTDHLDALKNTQNYSCGNSNGAFIDSLEDARSKLGTVRADAVAARSYWFDTIRPDLLAIKNQTPTANSN